MPRTRRPELEDETLDDAAEGSSVSAAQRVFHALSSAPRRKILAYLSASGLTAGEIADRFSMSKPAVSQHLSILETAGLIRREKQGQFVHYSMIENNLINTLNGFVQEVCPVGRPIKKESQARARAKELP
ncbi:ArsR family transcriptional regulator protein [Rhizobium etli bv. mimosae str. Mim1]|nr:ArsR family transcriptional regulator protein [Rhizobium etli bv. mimosae str. Mim1]